MVRPWIKYQMAYLNAIFMVNSTLEYGWHLTKMMTEMGELLTG